MSVESHAGHEDKRNHILEATPNVQIFLRPIAPPAALGLAGFAGSTWITASYIANWWGNSESPTIFFPFVGIFGGSSLDHPSNKKLPLADDWGNQVWHSSSPASKDMKRETHSSP